LRPKADTPGKEEKNKENDPEGVAEEKVDRGGAEQLF
jgi:hypothetical protein